MKPEPGRRRRLNDPISHDFTRHAPDSPPWKQKDAGDVVSRSLHFPYVCLCEEVALTEVLRGGLVFLDGHMSSSRRNQKHLKVTFAEIVAAASAAEAEAVRKDEKDTEMLSRYRNNPLVCRGGHGPTLERFGSLCSTNRSLRSRLFKQAAKLHSHPSQLLHSL